MRQNIDRRVGSLAIAALLVLLLCPPRGSVGAEKLAAAQRAPNIVLILADDLGAECLGCYGGTSYRTPCLDRLAARGVRFDRCYANPVCSPSRSELLTGRYCFRTGITYITHRGKPRADKLDLAVHRTFANVLGEAGYATCIAGKWHLANDFADHPTHVADAGFQDRFLWRLLRGNQVVRHYWNPELWVDDQANKALGRGKFGDDLFTEHALQFMRRQRDRPFLLYYPMTLVHTQTATGSNYPASPDTLQPNADPDAGVQPKQKGFADLVAYMDKLVGRIADEIDRLGLAESTLLLFAGDNGTDGVVSSRLGERELRGGKGRLDEAGTRVPLIAVWQGVAPAGVVVRDMVDFTDFFPTILDATGVKISPDYPIDGRSFLPQVRGQQGQPRDWVYRHLADHWVVRGDRYRLDDSGTLWDLGEDAYHATPASDTPKVAEARKRLAAAASQVHNDPRFPPVIQNATSKER